MKKRVLSLIMASAMLFTTACSTGEGTGTTETSSVTDTTEVAETTEDGKLNIEIWNIWTGNGGDCLQEIADEFNASQDKYHITLTFSGTYAETFAKYQATTEGNRPDAVMASTEYVAYFADNPEYYVPAQKYIEEDNYDISDLMPNLINAYTDANGDMMCIPFGNTVVGFWYNTEVLEAAGIDPVNDLDSYEEIGEACAKLKENGVECPIYIPQNSIFYTFPITSEGLDYVDNDNGKSDICTKSLISEEPLASVTTKYFKFIQERQANGELASRDLTSSDVRQMFVDGKIGIMFSTISVLTYIGEQCNWEVEFGFHPSPTVSEGAENVGQCTSGGALFISNNGDEARERGVWEFLKCLMEPENAAAFAMSTGYLPITKAGYETEAYQNFIEEYFPTAIYSIEAQNATSEDCYNAFLPMFADFHEIVIEYTDKVINDLSYSPEEATKDFAAAVDESIELYNLSR